MKVADGMSSVVLFVMQYNVALPFELVDKIYQGALPKARLNTLYDIILIFEPGIFLGIY